MVRPFAQTSLANLTARGPRVAQASTTNSPSTDMDLAKESGYLWAAARRQPAPLLATPEWMLPSPGARGPVRYLLDTTPGGRVDAFRLSYTSSGTPTWQLTAGGLRTDSATVAADWHRLTLSSRSAGEPFLTSKQGTVSFTIGSNGSQLAVEEGSAPARQHSAVPSAGGSATGLWYAAVDNAIFGLFITDASTNASRSLLSGYLLGWSASTGAPSWKRLSATWSDNGINAQGVLSACRVATGTGSEACAAVASGVELGIEAGQLAATLSGLPGVSEPLSLQKATELTPML